MVAWRYHGEPEISWAAAMAVKRRPAVSALGVRWRLGNPSPHALAAVAAKAGVHARPLCRGRAARAARLRPGQAAWLLGGRVAVAAGPAKRPAKRAAKRPAERPAAGRVSVVAAAVARVAVAGVEVWVGPGETASVPVKGPGPWRVEAVVPPRCAPVMVRPGGHADALLGAPGVNLAVTDTAVAGWTDAVVVAPGGQFVCPCGARFADIAAINDHYAVKLIGDNYRPLLAEAPDQRPAGTYTPTVPATVCHHKIETAALGAAEPRDAAR